MRNYCNGAAVNCYIGGDRSWKINGEIFREKASVFSSISAGDVVGMALDTDTRTSVINKAITGNCS